MRPSRRNSRSRPGGSGTHVGPWQRPSGFASQPVATCASRAGHQRASPDASAPATACSPDSVSMVTMAPAPPRPVVCPNLAIGTAHRPENQSRPPLTLRRNLPAVTVLVGYPLAASETKELRRVVRSDLAPVLIWSPREDAVEEFPRLGPGRLGVREVVAPQHVVDHDHVAEADPAVVLHELAEHVALPVLVGQHRGPGLSVVGGRGRL